MRTDADCVWASGPGAGPSVLQWAELPPLEAPGGREGLLQGVMERK